MASARGGGLYAAAPTQKRSVTLDTQEQVSTMPVDHEKDTRFANVLIATPTFGKVSEAFHISDKTMGAPIFCNVAIQTIRGKPVDVARCEFADMLIKSKFGFLFFRDDDVIVPQNALINLLERFPHKQKTNPHEADMLVGGVVYSKATPPVPMIHIDGYTAGFEDWNPGDFFEVDAIGMGCTLLPVGAFLKLLPHITKYRCKNDLCPEPWGEYDKQDVETQVCPRCGDFLVPGFFKTVRDPNKRGDFSTPMISTEDSYFTLLAKEKAGIKTFVDTGVLCEHEVFHPSVRKTVYYGYYPGVGPGWRVMDMIYWYPSADQEDFHKTTLARVALSREKETDVKFNLGSGGVNLEGYVNIDITTACDFKCDVRDLMEAVKKYGRPSEIYSSHLLEHISPHETLGVLRNWLRYLAPGGTIKMQVPDGIKALEGALEAAKATDGMDLFPELVVYGAQRYPGDEHRALLYRKKLEAMFFACKNQIDSYVITEIAKGTPIDGGKGGILNQDVLDITIVKKGVDVDEDETAGTVCGATADPACG